MYRLLFLSLFIFILVTWLLWPKDKAPAPLNQLSLEQPTEAVSIPAEMQESNTITGDTTAADVQENNQAFAHQDTKVRSYLQLYRDFRLAEYCPPGLVTNQISKKSYVQQHLEQFESAGIENNTTVSINQISRYEQHLQQCLRLSKKYPKASDSMVLYLSQQLLTTSASTDKEKQLQTLRRLIGPWDSAWQKLFSAAKGISSPEAQAVLQQLTDLQDNWRQQTRGIEFQDITDAMYTSQREAKQALQTQLDELVNKDPKIKQKAWQRVEQLTAEIKQHMFLGDPDLFFEASALLGDDRHIRFLNGKTRQHFKREQLNELDIPYLQVGDEIMAATGNIARLNFLAISPFANQVFLCSLGHDCSSGSDIMNRYCLGTDRLIKQPVACEKDLLSFFTEDYLSPNQMQDVLNLYEQLEIYYAP